jgi:hypothetical protein
MANLKGSYYYTQRALGILDATPKYYVYLLKHPQTNEVFYVGKGEDKRMYQHVRQEAIIQAGKMSCISS